LVKKSVILIFDSTHITMKAEEIIKKNKISNMIVPKPKGIESRCGVALKVYESDLPKIKSLLWGQVLKYNIFENAGSKS